MGESNAKNFGFLWPESPHRNFQPFLCMEIPSLWQIPCKKNTLHIHLLTLIDNLHSKIWRWHWAATPDWFWTSKSSKLGHPWLFIQEGSRLHCTTPAALRTLGTHLQWQAQTPTDSVHALDWMGSSGSKGLAQKSPVCNKVTPCPSPDVRQREHVPVLCGAGDAFAPFLLFFALRDACLKGSEQLTDWCLHYTAQYLKQINRRFFIKIRIKPFWYWKKSSGLKSTEGKGRNKRMDRKKYFPYLPQKYIKLHSWYFLCIYTMIVLSSPLPINILQ